MNWTDLVVIGIIVGFAVFGMRKGFILSVYRLISYVLSIFLAIKLYPFVSKFLTGTALYGNIKDYILKNLLLQQPDINSGAKTAAADAVVNNLQLPGFMKDFLIDKFPNPTDIVDVSGIMEKISNELTGIVINVISLAVLYILVRVILIFTKFILKGIAGLPLFKQLDKLGGFGLGAVEGFLTVYILLAILMIFSTSPRFEGVFKDIDGSLITGFIYNHNFIISFLFPGS